ncbi:MAG TPA: AAA family ATPase, partial [Myxococcota bacterium]|nr:AAA family ATPase [Myxococcota bacterium]
TTDEYRKYIEEDPALERRFLPIIVEAADEELATAILRGIKNTYEIHHGVRIDDDAVVAAVKLSARYITERALPDKAIDLMDEAAGRLRMELDSVPSELDDAEREVQQLQIELRALENEKSTTATRRRAEVEKRVTTAAATTQAMRTKWERERELIATRRQVLAEKEATEQSLAGAERGGELGRAAELKYGALPKIVEKLDAAEAALAALDKEGGRLLKEHVGPDDVAKVVALWTNIPVSRMLEEERVKLVQMDDRLRQRVVGQDHAIKAIGDAVRLSRAGLGDPNKPIGSFMFLGPTGVGKTELARALAEFLFDGEAAMVRLDMGEFMEKAAAQRLTGAPPGYVGYDEGGQLTEAVRRRPYAVLLFDEVEKAHPDVFNTLLQLLDEGRLTDSHGKLANYANTVVIMTSNLGGQDILELSGKDDEAMEAKVRAAVKSFFRPEFVNRIDEILVFRALGKEQLALIFDIQLKKLKKLLDGRQIGMEVTAPAKASIVEAGYDPRYGARPLKRAMTAMLQKPLAAKLLAGEFADNDTIVVDAAGPKVEELTFAKKAAG